MLYVDDMPIMDQDADMIQKLKRELSKTFNMKDLGSAKRILGMEILYDKKCDAPKPGVPLTTRQPAE